MLVIALGEVVTAPGQVATAPSEVVIAPAQVVTALSMLVIALTVLLIASGQVVTAPSKVVTAPSEIVIDRHQQGFIQRVTKALGNPLVARGKPESLHWQKPLRLPTTSAKLNDPDLPITKEITEISQSNQ